MSHNKKNFSERKTTFYLGISKVALFENTSCGFSMEILLINRFLPADTLIFFKSWQFFGSFYFLCHGVSEKERIQLKAFFFFFLDLTTLPDFISLTISKLVTQ